MSSFLDWVRKTAVGAGGDDDDEQYDLISDGDDETSSSSSEAGEAASSSSSGWEPIRAADAYSPYTVGTLTVDVKRGLISGLRFNRAETIVGVFPLDEECVRFAACVRVGAHLIRWYVVDRDARRVVSTTENAVNGIYRSDVFRNTTCDEFLVGSNVHRPVTGGAIQHVRLLPTFLAFGRERITNDVVRVAEADGGVRVEQHRDGRVFVNAMIVSETPIRGAVVQTPDSAALVFATGSNAVLVAAGGVLNRWDLPSPDAHVVSTCGDRSVLVRAGERWWVLHL